VLQSDTMLFALQFKWLFQYLTQINHNQTSMLHSLHEYPLPISRKEKNIVSLTNIADIVFKLER